MSFQSHTAPFALRILAITGVLSALSACSSPTEQSRALVPALSCKAIIAPSQSETSIAGLTLVGRYVADAPFATSAAEIVKYDACTDQLFVVNAQAKKVDVLTLSHDHAPSLKTQLDLQRAATHAGIEIGAANSVSTHQGWVAVAIENSIKQEAGIIALYRGDTFELLTTYPAGALPDMVSFSKDGRYIAAANEGEPNSDYSVDPEGSVTLIDLSTGYQNAIVTQIGFTDFNEGGVRHEELGSDVRLSAPSASVAQDLEPEYLAFDDKGQLFVALQENNALAKIDVTTRRVESIYGLGGKSWPTATLDASNKDKRLGHFQSYPQLVGLYMPDSIATYSVDGVSYIITANEGDGREYGFDSTQQQCDSKGYQWDGDDYSDTADYGSKVDFCIAYSDELRGKKLKVSDDHPLALALKDNQLLARLKVIDPGKTLQKNEVVEAFGARSFSIWNEQGERVYDSGDQFAQIVFATQPEHFNSTNDNNDSADDRSDDKGVEPEAIEVAQINGRHYAFIGLERQGGIMVYDVTDPSDAMFLHYVNPRDFNQPVCTKVDEGECDNETYNPKAGDLGPESIHYFTRAGEHFIAVGNEVSGTTSIFHIDL